MTEETTRWLTPLRELAARAGCTSVLAALDRLESAAPCATVAIVGAPNSGKSTLLNELVERPLIAVTPLPSGAEVRVSADERESIVVNRAVLSLDALPVQLPEHAAAHFTIDHEWLRRRELCLLERRALDATDEEAAAAVAAALDGADLLLLVVDAMMPIRRIEPVLLHEADRRLLPVVVVLTKTDLVAAVEERQRVREYVQHYVDLAAAGTSVIDVRAQGVAAVREALDALVSALDLESARDAQTRRSLQELAQTVLAAAEAAQTASAASSEEVEAQLAQRRRSVELERLGWTELELELEQRRRRIDDKVREQIASHHPGLMQALEYEVEKAADLRVFWERDFPFVLQRELRFGSALIAEQVNRAVADDFRWLRDELRTRFGAEAAPAVPEPQVVTSVPPPVPRTTLPLADTNVLRMLLGGSVSAAVILAGRYLDRARIPFVSLAFAVLGMPATDQILNRTTAKDRAYVQRQVRKVVDQADRDYIASVSSNLKAAYADALRAMRERRDASHAAQFETVRSVAATNDGPRAVDWGAIAGEANAIANQLADDEGSAQ